MGRQSRRRKYTRHECICKYAYKTRNARCDTATPQQRGSLGHLLPVLQGELLWSCKVQNTHLLETCMWRPNLYGMIGLRDPISVLKHEYYP